MSHADIDLWSRHWFAIVRVEEAVPRHVVQSQLLGQELAIWRDDSGLINVWENRCPHRGVRLTIGLNTGTQLRCRYHGWRYASQTGRCDFMPAQPGRKPAAAMRARVLGCTERHGFVWANLSAEAARLPIPTLAGNSFTTFRSLHVQAHPAKVAEFLRIDHASERQTTLTLEGDLPLRMPGQEGLGPLPIRLLLLPMNREETLIHAVTDRRLEGDLRLEALRRQDVRMTAIRDAIEAGAAGSPGQVIAELRETGR